MAKSKVPFGFHTFPADWGKHLPDGDYTIGRGADPRLVEQRIPDGNQECPQTDATSDLTATNEADRDRRPSAAE